MVTRRSTFGHLGRAAAIVLLAYGAVGALPGLSTPAASPVILPFPGKPPRAVAAPAGATYHLFGNGVSGDCVIAALANVSEADAARAGVPFRLGTGAVMRFYRAVETPPGGTDFVTAFRWWQRHAFAGGRLVHFYPIATTKRNIEVAIDQTGAVVQGLTLPESIVRLRPGQPWDLQWLRGQTSPLGGHAVALVGYNSRGVVAVTWGYRNFISWPFLLRAGRGPAQWRGQETWALIPPDVVRAGGYPGHPLAQIVAARGGASH